MSEVDPAQLTQKLLGQVVAGRYRLEAPLGTGSAGAVYRARDREGHDVALKILDPALMASNAAQRFTRESEVMLGIQHPHVVDTLAAGRDDTLGVLYLVMPLLLGEDLDALLMRTGALEPSAAVRLAIQAARGIGAAHGVGVVHRDIKPANLFLDRAANGQITVRVCDFGIAKRLASGSAGEAALTATGTQLGTPDYVAPEQLRNSKDVDERADIWGLGATLYETLCGEPPYAQHAGIFDIIGAILTEDVRALLQRAPWLEPELAAVVHRALQKNPGARFRSMHDFADALRPHSQGGERLLQSDLATASRKLPEPAKLEQAFLAAPSPKPGLPVSVPPTAKRSPVARRKAQEPAAMTPAGSRSSREAARRTSRNSWLAFACLAIAIALGLLVFINRR